VRADRKPAVIDLADLVHWQTVFGGNSPGRFHKAAASDEANPRPVGQQMYGRLLLNRSGVQAAMYIGP